MNRSLAAALIGATLVAQAASAGDSFADAGRFQLIPRVLVPNKAGKVGEQSILLDTATGRTWRLTKDAKKDAKKEKTGGAHWVPLDTEFPERLYAEDPSRGIGREIAKRGAFDPNPNYISRQHRLDEYYDDNP